MNTLIKRAEEENVAGITAVMERINGSTARLYFPGSNTVELVTRSNFISVVNDYLSTDSTGFRYAISSRKREGVMEIYLVPLVDSA